MASEAKRKRRWWTEAEARAVLEEFARSGESANRFMGRRGFSGARLRYWQKRLAVSTRPTVARKPAFVAVAMPGAPRTTAKIEIHVGALTVCVREDLELDHFTGIVDALWRMQKC
jgi:hypothetical protein